MGSAANHLVIRTTAQPVVELGLNSATNTDGIRVESSGVVGYQTVTVLVPWTLLGGTPEKGRRVGIEVQVNDDDDGGPRDLKRATFADADDAWDRPSVFGSFVLGAPFRTIGGHTASLTVIDAQTNLPVSGADVYISTQRSSCAKVAGSLRRARDLRQPFGSFEAQDDLALPSLR